MRITTLLAAAASLAVCAAAPVAEAAVTTSTGASADLTLASIVTAGSLDGFSIAFDDVRVEDVETTGAASSDPETRVDRFDDPLGLGLGFDLSVAAYLDASAGDADGAGGAYDGIVESVTLMTLFNDTGDDVTVTFDVQTFAYVDLDATGALSGEDGASFADIEIVSDGDVLLTTSLVADLLTGETGGEAGDLRRIALIVAAGDVLDLEVTTAVEAFADAAPVPLPGAALFAGTGVLGLLAARRRA